jgi:hypothetical protein
MKNILSEKTLNFAIRIVKLSSLKRMKKGLKTTFGLFLSQDSFAKG